MQKYNKGFTLTEVILTIAIIGVIVSMTIPVLTTKIQKNQAYTGVMKALSSLSQAAISLRTNNSETFSGIAYSDSDLANAFSDKFKVVTFCNDSSDSANCYDVANVKNLNGGNYEGVTNFLSNHPKFLTNDDFVYTFIITDATSNCGSSSYVRNSIDEGCGEVYVDVNGKKSPNTVGKDIFVYSVNKFNLTPFEVAGDDYCNTSSGFSTNGKECATKAVSEGKIGYY